MADSVATKFIQALGQKLIHLENDDIRFQMVDAGYTVNLDTHATLNDVPGGNRVGAAVALATGKTFTDGIFNADSPLTYEATSVVAAGGWIYQHDTATPSYTLDSQRRLIFWVDGRTRVILGAAVNSGALLLPVYALEGPIPSGTVFNPGGFAVTTGADALEGDRTITLSSGPSSAIAAGATGEANKGQGWPIALSPGGVTLALNAGTSKIFRISR